MRYNIIINSLAAIIISSLPITANAAALRQPLQTKKLCNNSVTLFSQNKIAESFSLLKPYWPLPQAELDNLSYQTKTQMAMLSKRFGKAIGTDFIRTQKAGNSFLKHTYILKFEKTSIRFICVFYKPQNSWLVNSITWDDKTSLLFK